MKIQRFLEHHGVATNPFSDEDAQTDQVFKSACIASVFHPAWDKVFGDPAEPSTSVVFGEKGSGKTAMGLQIVRRLGEYNADHPDAQVFVVRYDDFNPFLDRFRERLSNRQRRPDRALSHWRLWDHMDAILSLAVTQLVDRLLQRRDTRHPAARDEPLPIDRLDASQRRDVLLLAACYDQSTADSAPQRWGELKRRLGFSAWRARWPLAVGALVTLVLVGLVAGWGNRQWWGAWPIALLLLALAAGWLPWVARRLRCWATAWRIARHTRSLRHQVGWLRRFLGDFTAGQILGQPLPAYPRTDDRYELLGKLEGVLGALGFRGVIVVVDRVDEPYLVNGATDLMRALVWPILDNKFLKHPGLGIKLLLPIELERLIDREDAAFHQRARLDKQNMVRSLAWTGHSLYDLAAARLRACALPGAEPSLAEWFDASVGEQRLVEALATLRVPRNLFKFMYRVLTTHCNAHSDDQPVWRIPSGTFESVLAIYQRELDAFDRGVGAV